MVISEGKVISKLVSIRSLFILSQQTKDVVYVAVIAWC